MVEILDLRSLMPTGKVPDAPSALDGDALRRNLAALARGGSGDKDKLRKDMLAQLRPVFQEARETVRKRFESGVTPGMAAARAISAIQDTTIQVLCDFAARHVYATHAGSSERIAVLATGGYGRGLLAPHSDVDLLFLGPAKLTPWSESVIEFVLHTLWDLGLKVGHAVRTLSDCVRLGKQDITIRTSLMEARHLWGDAPLGEEMKRKFWSDIATGNGQDFVDAKLAERDARHIRQGQSRYLVEPNIKEGKGGLRDLQTLYWIGKYIYRVEDAEDLIQFNVLTKEEFKTFQKAESFLWTVRCHLHYLARGGEERLSFDVQPDLAKRMGYVDENMHKAVERFMRSYFLVAKDVGDLTRIFCAALEEQNRKTKPSLRAMLPGFLKLRGGGEDFFVENGRLSARPNLFQDNPVNLIRLFHVADAKGVDIHPATLRTVTRSLELIDEEMRHDPVANRLFLDILTSRRDPETALRRMNEAGVLGRFMPEFGRVVALMQFNMYHHYTVDEHLLHAVGNASRIEHGELQAEHPLVSDLIKRVKSREVLFVAMLLHDMAKGLPGDHSEVGAAMAQSICPRLGLSPMETETVAWLVLHHLAMSDMAQKRDVSDPKTVQDFVRLVQTPERLRLLLIVTVADIRAVGPGVWNGWKGQLLRELYLESEMLMSGGESTQGRGARILEAKETLAARIKDMKPEIRDGIIARHYDPYWLAFDAKRHEFHARLIADADAKGIKIAIGAEHDTFNAVSEIVVYTPDHPGLFSRLAGAISLSGGTIVDAKIFTTSDGFALDVFRVQDAENAPFGDESRIARLKQTIARTLAGEVAPRMELAKRGVTRRASAFRIRPRVNFDNEASRISTVIEVESLDRVGLLYAITRALFDAGLSISSAIVATYGEMAVDVFYVRDGFGHKIVHPDRLAAVEALLMKALEGQSVE